MKLRHPFNLLLQILAAVVLTPALVIGLTCVVATRITALPDGVAFRMYGTDVSEADLKHRLNMLRAMYGIEAPPDPAQADRFRRQSTQAIVMSMVLDRAARDEGMVVDQSAREEALAAFVAARFPDGRAGFVRLLGEVGAAEQDVVDELARQQSTAQLYNKIVVARGAEFDPTVEELRAYYDRNREAFVRPELRHLRNIVVSGEDQAKQIADQARAGTDFGRLAQQFSLDPTSKDSGGDLGVVAKAKLEDDYGAAAFAAPPGGVFGPVRAKRGWNVGQVVEMQPAVPIAFEEVIGGLRTELRKRRSMEFWRGWVSDQIRRAGVEYVDAYRPSDPGSPLSTEQETLAPVPAQEPR